MSKEIKSVLLSNILSSQGVYHNKYSNAYNSLKSVMELELKEKKEKLPKYIFEKYKEIQKLYSSPHEKLTGVSVLVLEQYFMRNSHDLSSYIFIDYNDKDYGDFKCIELYEILETFFSEVFLLATLVADYYTFEVKLKDGDDEDKQIDTL